MMYMQDLKNRMQQQMALASLRVKNAVFDVILYEPNKRCLEQNIVFNKQILYNNISFLSYMDTGSIVANVLENSVKACSDIKLGIKKMKMSIKRYKAILSIMIKNAKQNQILEKNDPLVLSKSDQETHSFGVENMKLAVSNYNEMVSIEHTDDKFSLDICFPIFCTQISEKN